MDDNLNKIDNKEGNHIGTIAITSKGTGYVDVPEFDDDVFIESDDVNTALHGDSVEIELLSTDGKQPAGKVLKIVERARTEFVGRVEHKEGANFSFVVPDDRKMHTDFFVPQKLSADAKQGDKVLVKLDSWEGSKKNPTGEVIKIIGRHGEHDTEMKAIVYARGFDVSFPEDISREAEEVAEREKPIIENQSEVERRKDFRDRLTFTIDPASAKDFDDAISYKDLGDGKIELGVHIADVSYFVREGTAVDKEARRRGFSVYLVDRTIPMLPEVFSNDLCSLNPNENKFAFSAVFELDANGSVQSEWFGQTLISSDRRFAYEEAQAVMDAVTGEHPDEHAHLPEAQEADVEKFGEALTATNSIAKKLRNERFKEGAIDFEKDELAFELNDKGEPTRIYTKQRLDVHKMIEEFMLLANRQVARFMSKSMDKKGGEEKGEKNEFKRSFIYRVHDMPDPEKLSNLKEFLNAMGYEFKLRDDGTIPSKQMNDLLHSVRGTPEESLITTAAIRSMSKAVYSTENVGHYGLAFEYYTHFTSPIRRYSDLLVHRLLTKQLEGQKISSGEYSKYYQLAKDISEKEGDAADAERESQKYKQVEYMKQFVGDVRRGVISGVTEWGIYIEDEETKASGMVKLRDLNDDFYELDKKNYALVGQKTGKRYALGDEVNYKVTAANVDDKMLDYTFVD